MFAWQKASLRIVGVAGVAVFATFFSFTYSVPGWVDKYAADFIENEVTEQVDSRIDNFAVQEGDSSISRFAAALYQQNEQQAESLKTALKADAHDRMAEALAQIRNLDCECRDKYAQILERGFEFDIALLQAANDRIVAFLQGTYMQIVAELTRDIRVFTGSNVGVFLVLLLTTFLKPQAIRHLFVPAVLLLVATAVCSYCYLFEQNWLLTIIYSDYLGFWYLGYLVIVFLFLCDIFFNRGRITTNIVNGILEAAGSTLLWAPC